MGYYDDYLEHHGILGQKWGVRRFESKNGHLTAAGKARYDGDKVTEKEKHAFSAKAAGWKALSKTQAMNAKVYDKLGNKSMASIQKKVSKEANTLAEKAQKEADAKKAERESSKGEKKGLTDKQKKVIATGAVIAGTALAAYGGYKLYQMNANKSSKTPLAQEKLKRQVSYELQKNLNETARVSKSAVTSSLSSLGTQRTESPKTFEQVFSTSQNVAKTVKADPTKVYNQKTFNMPSQTSTMKFHGQQKFIDAAKANDDLVQELLKKNTLRF